MSDAFNDNVPTVNFKIYSRISRAQTNEYLIIRS